LFDFMISNFPNLSTRPTGHRFPVLNSGDVRREPAGKNFLKMGCQFANWRFRRLPMDRNVNREGVCSLHHCSLSISPQASSNECPLNGRLMSIILTKKGNSVNCAAAQFPVRVTGAVIGGDIAAAAEEVPGLHPPLLIVVVRNGNMGAD